MAAKKVNRIEMAADRMSSGEAMKKVLRIIGGYRVLLLLSIILAAVSVILQLYVPILFGRAIDGIIAKGQVKFSLVSGYLRQILLWVLIAAAATWVMNLINNRLTYQIIRDIRARAIRQLQVLPLSYLDAHSAGDIVSRIIADTDQLSDGLLLGFSQLFSGVLTILATLVFMFSINWWISLIVVLLTPLSFWVARFIASHSYKMFHHQTETRGEQTALIEEMIGGQKLVQAFGYQQRSSQRFRKLNKQLQYYSQNAIFYSSITNPSTRFVNAIIYALVALAGSFAILSGGLTVGGLSVLLNYSNQYMKPFNDISSVITELQNALACAARIFALIEEKPEPAAVTVPAFKKQLAHQQTLPAMPTAQGYVGLDHVDFSYVPEQKLIQDFNLQTKPGMRVALVGPTGCGKTTTINLLMRFYDPQAGQIKVDDHRIDQVTRHSLRANYGMVLQDTWIKTGTVRENVAFGKPEASDEEIIAACKEARSWSFIKRLPQGLDTVLTNDSLSQGQRQLLCITRVMLALPPMLILDEATSSIDTRTELLVQAAFDKLMEGRTSFVVAHRLSTIRQADLILVMKDGQIIERGTHEELMAKGGFYTNLYNSQFAHLA
ncbi:MAG: ABC transporter ATP-binding protein/permease [Lactobacillus sp.]|jgi:ATP-binding cassette subfamily B protein|nr:ABC transporter ATP-binding protein/permease [Lactobacillus sp.]MCH3990587.1 ABC transporter ATP-binding protein/permease [Lactobacillus sp.]MCH4068698.1 ABC transporter ATP-binding protein/permease [Lactobacillus sp.]MCI1303817.1 ABC transporter ATP-binding protein/permease [Lactobacillus sp.]MCI1330201.1 ABC transporter ATP-binding protein/permease [Lactobacillus sp.]